MSGLRERLEAFGIRPRKSLGQNFLHDTAALEAIGAAVSEAEPSHLVEIGPGPGTLTDVLAGLGLPLAAVEKDPRLVELLTTHFADQAHVRIVPGDVLKTDLVALHPEGARPSVVGNIPYNISTPIVLHLVEQRAAIGPATLMLQAELAERLRAPVGSRESGSMTVLLAMLAEIDRIRSLAPGAFFPPPKVRSEVIRIRWRAQPAEPVSDLAAFERTVRAGFSLRRKTLRNALRSRFDIEAVESAGKRVDLDMGRRAETLSLGEWARLTEALLDTSASEA